MRGQVGCSLRRRMDRRGTPVRSTPRTSRASRRLPGAAGRRRPRRIRRRRPPRERAPARLRSSASCRSTQGTTSCDEVVLPDAGPFAPVGVDCRAGDRHHRDERRAARGDQPVGDLGQAHGVEDRRGRAAHPVQQVDDGVAARRVVAGRQVDRARDACRRDERIGDPAFPDGSAGRAVGGVEPAGRDEERDDCGSHRERHGSMEAPAREAPREAGITALRCLVVSRYNFDT